MASPFGTAETRGSSVGVESQNEGRDVHAGGVFVDFGDWMTCDAVKKLGRDQRLGGLVVLWLNFES
jgi:hypothetical protein